MISIEQRARVRRLFFAEHWRVGTIAAELGLHVDAVKLAIEVERFAPAARLVRPTMLDPYKDFIKATLDQYPRLRATRLHQMIASRGYAGSVVQLRRYVKTIRPTRREAYLRLETLPGEQGQVDWGHFGTIQVGAARRPLSCFVLVLSFSRALYARFFLDQSLETFLQGHVEAFEALGGAPRVLLYDNLKTAVLERDGNLIRFHPQLLQLAGHYHFEPRPCAPYRGNEKGKVERTIQFVRHSFFAARRLTSLDALNAELRVWCEEVAHARPVPRDPSGRAVRDALAEEAPRLLPLPQARFPTDRLVTVRSGKTPYVRFDKNDYSIPHRLVRQALTLVASEARVRILDATGQLVATHARSYARGMTIEDPEHVRELARQKQRASTSGRNRIIQACPHGQEFFTELCARDQPLGASCARLGRLLDRYGAEALDGALARALECGAISAASVAHLIDQQRRERDEAPPLSPFLSGDPRVAALRVTPHSLVPYDELANAAVDAPVHTEEPDDAS